MDWKKTLEEALDWAGIDYLVQQTQDGGQTRITINTSDIEPLVDRLLDGCR